MQLSYSQIAANGNSCSIRRSRSCRLSVRAQAPLSGTTGGASSNSTGTSSVAPLTFDRPAGGGSRSYDLPRSSDSSLTFWAPRSDLVRPSNGASRGAVFAAAGSEGPAGSIDRPGGRGGRFDMPGGDAPSGTNPSDPALARPGGRGGRDGGLSSSDGPAGPVSIERPGGRGGRDSSLSSIDQPGGTPSIDRPGGRGGRDGPSGGDNGGSSGGGSSGGGSGGSGSGDGSSGEGGFSLGKGIGGAALYAGVIAAAWYGYQAMNPPKEAEPVKPCCAGKGKKK